MEELRIVHTIDQQIKELEKEIQNKKQDLAALRRKSAPRKVENYSFQNFKQNEVLFSNLFGEKKELLLIFNMGKSCRYCTLWADGFNGLTGHLENKASFVLVTPDNPEVAEEFATSRGWRFNIVSDSENTFRQDLGFRDEKGVWPVVAVFTKDADDNISLRSSSILGPGDNYCVMWDLIDLLPEGTSNWEPQYSY